MRDDLTLMIVEFAGMIDFIAQKGLKPRIDEVFALGDIAADSIASSWAGSSARSGLRSARAGGECL